MPLKSFKTVDDTRFVREVAYIGISLGVRGGESWRLVLSCGHFMYRRKDPIRPGARFARLAPARAECLSCASGVRACDLESAIALAKSLDQSSAPEASIP